MTETATYESILTEVKDGVATITLNRPPRNEWGGSMGSELNRAINAFDADDSVRVIVVAGNGKYFCAGAALGGRARAQGDGAAAQQRPQRSEQQRQARRAASDGPQLKRPWQTSTPIIAAMNGSAAGVGMTFPMQYDIRFMADEAKYGFVFVRRGWAAELGAHWIVPRVVGVSKAMDLLISGRYFNGQEAEQIGLCTKSLPGDEVLPYAQEYARELATNVAPVSAAAAKRLVWKMLEEPMTFAEASALDGRIYGGLTRTPDGREGVTSFLEKREPNWTMSKTDDLPEELRS